MRDDIFDYLVEFGFDNKTVKKFEKDNSEVFYVQLKDVQENIEFLLEKGLTKGEIIEIIIKNPFMLTDERNRRDYYDNIYLNTLGLDNQEIVDMIKKNSDIFTASPIELENIIKYLSNSYDINRIKKMLISNPNIITMKLVQVKQEIKWV